MTILATKKAMTPPKRLFGFVAVAVENEIAPRRTGYLFVSCDQVPAKWRVNHAKHV
jgi:hypothetical protein